MRSRWPERRAIYARCSWGRYCISVPAEWLGQFHDYIKESGGLEFVDCGGDRLYARIATAQGVSDIRPWEECPLPLRVIRMVRPCCPVVRAVNGVKYRLWIERVRVIGKTSRCRGTVVVAIPPDWIDAQLAGQKSPEDLWVYDDGEYLVITLKRPEITSHERPWGNAIIPRVTVKELGRLTATYHHQSAKQAVS